jgi:hypothetical protein
MSKRVIIYIVLIIIFFVFNLLAVSKNTTFDAAVSVDQITSLENQTQLSADKIALLEKKINKQAPFWLQILLGFVGGIGALLLDRGFKLYDEQKVRGRILNNLFFEVKENYFRLLTWQKNKVFRKFLTAQFEYFEEIKNTSFDFDYPYMQDIFYSYKDWSVKYNRFFLKD